MQWKTITPVLALLLAPAASGCLALTDDDGPVLSIELYWDARPFTADFFRGTCRQADVRWMEWTLYKVEFDRRGRPREVEVASRSEPCADGIDVIEPEPGEYWLNITGLDRDDRPVWQADCPMSEDATLPVLRFDVAYACDIRAP
jgi:hypothetical protein